MKQREIKFRAWDEIHKIMHNDFQFIKSGNEGNDWIVFTSDRQTLNDFPHPFEDPYLQKQLKIMQFTGLLDKNGREIYEGDVIKWIHKHGDFEPTEQVSTVEYQKYSDGWIGYEVFNDAEVIGNLYENPELLK